MALECEQENSGQEMNDRELLLRGEPPENGSLLRKLSEGLDSLTDFWTEKYLKEYINLGGSKIKFVTGRPGSGKSHFLNLFSDIAKENRFITVHFSAREVWLHDFKEIYAQILNQCDIMACLKGCALKIVKTMGYEEAQIPEEKTFMDYLSERDGVDALTRREIRIQLKNMFLDNPLMDNNFALACSLLTGGILGHPLLEQTNRQLLLSWLEGDKTVKLSLLRALGLSPSRITRYNARHMLRSLAEVVHMGGYAGIVVTIDNMEVLLNRSSLEPIHYTKLRREDTYESIRQLIDDIDSLKYIMFIFGFERSLLDDDNSGLKSYQALWMRIQNEIIGERFNRFTDIVDLDRFAQQEYTPQVLIRMSEKLAAAVSPEENAVNFSQEQAEEIINQSKLGGIGIPRMVSEATFGGGVHV